MRERTCCFTGHRRMTAAQREYLTPWLEKTVIELIKQGVVYFGVGGAIGFDTLAAMTVLRLRHRFPHIRLIMVLPCEDMTARWSAHEREQLDYLLRRADKVVYMTKTYTPECMKQRDRHLVDHSGVCVAWLTHYGGGTGYTVEYARRRGVKVITPPSGV